MPRRRPTQRSPIPVPAGLVRAALAASAAAGLIAAIPLAAAIPARAAAGRPAVAPPAVSVVINSVRPGYASPGHTVTVTGSVTNSSAARIAAPTIQLSSSTQAFSSRDTLGEYASGAAVSLTPVHSAVAALRGTLAPSATAHWSIKLPVSKLRLTSFGVYPLAAEAKSALGTMLADGRTFLPFWPGKTDLDPARQQISWIWPLIDQPRQSACSGLVSNGLSGSVATGGRLSTLLTAGAAYTSTAHLTWVLDPALLADAQTMSGPYQVSSATGCTAAKQPASQAARSWLHELKTVTANQGMFVTPYADVDAIALVHQGLNSDLARSFSEGRAVAGNILGRDFKPPSAGGSAGSRSAVLNGLAWPPGGIADYPTLQSLAGVDGVSSVILDSTTMPPLATWPPTPSAQATTPDGEGPDLHVLVSDHTLTSILGAANAAARTAGGSFTTRQYFLAQTAMIAAEAPNLSRSIVVAPPSRWDPPASVASGLLAETVSAPWLRPVSASSLVTAKLPASQPDRKLTLPAGATKGSLSGTLLRRVRHLDQRISLLQSIQQQPDTALSYAVAGVESSAWQGGRAAARPAWQLLSQISGYVNGQESKVMLVGPARVTLGGLKGTVPVSVANHLKYPVEVKLRVGVPGGGSISVRSQAGVLKVPAGAVVTVKLAVSTAAVGSTTLRLSLLTPQGKALPTPAVVMDVQATHYGTLALVIIAAALGVFMLTSATKAMRRGRGGPAQAGPGGPEFADGPSGQAEEGGHAGTVATTPPEAAMADGRDAQPGLAVSPAGPPSEAAEQAGWPDGRWAGPGEVAGADNVESGPSQEGGQAGPDDLEDADEYARPGRAGHGRGRPRP